MNRIKEGFGGSLYRLESKLITKSYSVLWHSHLTLCACVCHECMIVMLSCICKTLYALKQTHAHNQMAVPSHYG